MAETGAASENTIPSGRNAKDKATDLCIPAITYHQVLCDGAPFETQDANDRATVTVCVPRRLVAERGRKGVRRTGKVAAENANVGDYLRAVQQRDVRRLEEDLRAVVVQLEAGQYEA